MTERTTDYFNGQGKLYIAPITNGVQGAFAWLGNVPSLAITTEVEKQEHKESYTGNRSTDKVIYTGKTVSYSFALEELTTDNLARAFQGTVETVVAGTVTDETSATLNKGDIWALDKVNVSSVVIKDSTATAKTLVAGTDYIVNEDFGSIEFISTKTNLTMPLKASYSYGEAKKVKLLQDAAKEYAYRFEGLNTAEGNRPVLVEVHKASLDPAKQFDFINDDFAQLEVEGEALASNKGLVDVTMIA